MDTSERLIESTRELLAERGYVGTSPKAILQRAGAGQGSMYHHFSGKADLARTAIERTAGRMRQDVEVLLQGPGDPMERLIGYLERPRSVLTGCPVGRLTQDPEVMADPTLSRPVAETLEWLGRRITEVLTEARRNRQIDAALDPRRTAATVVATLQGGYVLAIAADDPDRFDQAVRGVVDLLGCARPGR